MPSIERRDLTDSESLGECYDGGVDRAEWQIVIPGDELRDPDPVAGEYRLGDQVSGGEIAEKPHLGRPAQALFDEVRNFCNDELRYEQRTGVGLEKVETLLVVSIVFVDVSVERSGIDDQRDLPASSRMISSIRRAVSRCPLLPALAAISFRRRPPR